MPPLESYGLVERAVYFPPGRDKYGDTTKGEGVEICCKWETGRREVIGSDNTPLALDCTLAVDRELTKGGLLFLGCLKDWLGTGSGANFDNSRELLEVKTYSENKDLKGRDIRREVGLTFFRHTTPENS